MFCHDTQWVDGKLFGTNSICILFWIFWWRDQFIIYCIVRFISYDVDCSTIIIQMYCSSFHQYTYWILVLNHIIGLIYFVGILFCEFHFVLSNHSIVFVKFWSSQYTCSSSPENDKHIVEKPRSSCLIWYKL